MKEVGQLGFSGLLGPVHSNVFGKRRPYEEKLVIASSVVKTG